MKPNSNRLRAIEGRLGRETTIWLTTVGENGQPHLMPIWFVWVNKKVYFAIGTDTQQYLDMTSNQSVALSSPDIDSVILIEGEAHGCSRQKTDDLAEHFYNKYEWDFRYDNDADWRLVEVTVHKLMAWGDGFDESDGIHVI